MLIYLMRHGAAMKQGAYSDADRPLTPDGELQAEAAGSALRRLDVKPQMLLASPAMRCQRMALIMAEALGIDEGSMRVAEALAVGGSPTRILRSIASLGELEELLLVGHQPELEALGSILLAGTTDVSLHLKRGGCICLELDAIPPSRPAVLHWLLTPQQLRYVAQRSKHAGHD